MGRRRQDAARHPALGDGQAHQGTQAIHGEEFGGPSGAACLAKLPPERLASVPSGPKSRRTRLIDSVLLTVAVLFMVGSAGVAGYFFGNHPAPHGAPDIGLRAVESNGRLRIAWNPGSPTLQDAGRVILVIRDGATRVEMTLEPELLKLGTVAYLRHGSRVNVRMRVFRRGDWVEELISFLDSSPPAQAAATL